MKLHTNSITNRDQLFDILFQLQDSGDIGQNVFFWVLEDGLKSRSHDYAYEIQLGAHTAEGGEGGKSRHYKTRDGNGGNIYAATYDEYGQFLAEIFREEGAKCGKYKNQEDFRVQTNYRFA